MKIHNNNLTMIKSWTLTLGVLTYFLCAGSFSWADVTLKLPKDIYVLAANGKNTKFCNTADLQDGINQIVIQYQGEPGARLSGDGDILYSDTFVLKFKAQSQTLEMAIPWIRTANALEKWNTTPDVRILNSGGDAIPIQISRLQKDGLQIFRDFAQELKAFNQTNEPAAVRQSSLPASSMNSKLTGDNVAMPTPSAAMVTHTPQQSARPGGMAEEMLKYWYQQADETTRQRFRTWIQGQ